jgi:hypothetical protein
VQTDLAKKAKEKENYQEGTRSFWSRFVGVRLTSRYCFRVIKFIMARGQCVVAKFSQESLDALCAALLAHAERLKSLFKPSWPNAEKVHEEMYNMVDTLIIHAVDQKWFSTFAKIGRMEEMVTYQEIHAVSWGGSFCNFFDTSTYNFMLTLPQNGECTYLLHQCGS